jgi:hypothetical protein
MDRTGIDAELAFRREHRDLRLQEELARACLLASSGAEIGAVHVYAGRRPTYEEIRHVRALAEQCGLKVTIHGDGRVTFRSESNGLDLQTNHQDHRIDWLRPVTAVEHRAELGLEWAKSHLRSWDAGFAGLREGVR